MAEINRRGPLALRLRELAARDGERSEPLARQVSRLLLHPIRTTYPLACHVSGALDVFTGCTLGYLSRRFILAMRRRTHQRVGSLHVEYDAAVGYLSRLFISAMRRRTHHRVGSLDVEYDASVVAVSQEDAHTLEFRTERHLVKDLRWQWWRWWWWWWWWWW